MKRILLLTVVFIMMLGTSFSFAQADADNFYKSDWVKVEKVSFSNQYKMKVAGNLFLPKTMKEGEKYPAIIVGHPMGAVKEQSARFSARSRFAKRYFPYRELRILAVRFLFHRKVLLSHINVSRYFL